MIDYKGLARRALYQINANGRLVVLRRDHAGAYSPSSGTFSGGSVIETPVKALFTDYSTREIDGEIVQRGDKQILIAGYTPVKDDLIIDDGKTWTILGIEEVKPGPVVMFYRVQARQ